jgi:hypothetical protein
MPILGTFLFNVFAAFAAFLAKYLTQKIAVTIAFVALLATLYGSLFYALRLALAAAMTSMTGVHPMFAVGVSTIISPHTVDLLSQYGVWWSAAQLYKWKFSIIQLWARTI